MERLGAKSTKAEFMIVLHRCDLDMKKRRSGFKVEWAHEAAHIKVGTSLG
jgi:hypothetical protein